MWRIVLCLLVLVAPVWGVGAKLPDVVPVESAAEKLRMEQSFHRIDGPIEEAGEGCLLVGGEGHRVYLHTGGVPVLDAVTGEFVSGAFHAGERVVAFVRNDTPYLLSYSEQVTPNLLVIHPDKGYSVELDYFPKSGFGLANRLVINALPETVYDNFGRLVPQERVWDHALIVMYDAATRSLPPQTWPKKVIVYRGSFPAVDDTLENEEGVTLYGLRSFAESFAAAVVWDEKSRTVQLGTPVAGTVAIDTNTVAIGEDSYRLATAFVNRNGHIYVGGDCLYLLWHNAARRLHVSSRPAQ